MKCPNCKNAILIKEDIFDTESSRDYYYDNVNGYCPECGKEFIWTERYKFDCVTDIREVE